MKFPVLFTSSKGYYQGDDRFNPFDISRDAFSYSGSGPVICHPPCRLFSRMRKFSTAPGCERLLAFYSVWMVRQYGGILEHPEGSALFKMFGFDLSGAVDNYGGFIRSVDLSWFGFKARKRTYLYFCGLKPGELPAMPISFDAPEYVVARYRNTDKRRRVLPDGERALTPPAMIEYFYRVMQLISDNAIPVRS